MKLNPPVTSDRIREGTITSDKIVKGTREGTAIVVTTEGGRTYEKHGDEPVRQTGGPS